MTKAAGGLVDVADLGTDTGWIPVGLVGSLSVSAGYHFSYRKLNGVVYIQGRVTGFTVSTSAFTVTATGAELPAGFRPDMPLLDLQMAAVNGTTWSRVTVSSAGVIQVTPGAATVGINGSFIPAPV